MDETTKMNRVNIEDAKKSSMLDYTSDDIAVIELSPGNLKSYNVRLDMGLIITVLQGELHISLNARDYVLHRNDFIICVKHDILGGYDSSADFQGKMLCVSHVVMQDSLYSRPTLLEEFFRLSECPVITLTERQCHLFTLYSDLLMDRMQSCTHAYHKEVILSLVRAVLFEVIACLSDAIPVAEPRKNTQQRVLFKRFIQLIVSQEVKPRSVAWYSDQLCITPKYLSSVCKIASNRTAFSWINEYVMADVRFLLKCTDLSIKEIADRLDFPNISFFGKYVRHHTGVSPSDYRHQLRMGK